MYVRVLYGDRHVKAPFLRLQGPGDVSTATLRHSQVHLLRGRLNALALHQAILTGSITVLYIHYPASLQSTLHPRYSTFAAFTTHAAKLF